VRLAGGRRIEALSFLSDTGHPQWAGALSLERQAELIAGAAGLSGRNVDYLADLVMHLREEGIRDRVMETLLGMVEAREAARLEV
jgi:cation transport protein ChaC